MAKIAPGGQFPRYGMREFRRSGTYTQMWRGRLIVRRKPRFKPRILSAKEQATRDGMKILAGALRDVPWWDQAYARQLAYNTLLTYRDVLSLAMLGRLVIIPGVLPDMQYPDLDLIGVTPGSLLYRTETNWVILLPGNDDEVMTMVEGFPRWKVAVSGGGGGSGLFSAEMSSPPTAASTGLTTWRNQGTASTHNAPSGFTLQNPATGSQQLRGVEKTIGSLFRATALLSVTGGLGDGSTNPAAYFGFCDGTKIEGIGLIQAGGTNANYLSVSRWNNNTTFSAHDVLWQSTGTLRKWVQVEKDSSKIYFRYSEDGDNYNTLYSAPITTFLANANIFGLYSTRPLTDNNFVSLLSYDQL